MNEKEKALNYIESVITSDNEFTIEEFNKAMSVLREDNNRDFKMLSYKEIEELYNNHKQKFIFTKDFLKELKKNYVK